jgi:hypothetical protein
MFKNHLFTLPAILIAFLFCTPTLVHAQNVGIGIENPSARLHLNGDMKIEGANTLEFGAGIANKEPNAGKIGYGIFTPGGLDIVGAGNSGSVRKIVFWAEGGSLFKGDLVTNQSLLVLGNATVDNDLNVNGLLGVGLSSHFLEYTLGSSSLGSYTISCPTGSRIVTGGGGHRDFNTAAADIRVSFSGPLASSPLTTWRLILHNSNGSASRTVRIYCICARIN